MCALIQFSLILKYVCSTTGHRRGAGKPTMKSSVHEWSTLTIASFHQIRERIGFENNTLMQPALRTTHENGNLFLV